MEWLKLLYGFFMANILGYGGGPASIPLLYQEIVFHQNWLNHTEFSSMLALGNALPGPIATKIAAYVGFGVAGWFGFLVALAATVVPSAAALIILLRILKRYRQTQIVRGMTLFVQPVIAIMMLMLTWNTAKDAISSIGGIQFFGIAIISLGLMTIKQVKVHPAYIIIAAFVYGGVFLS